MEIDARTCGGAAYGADADHRSVLRSAVDVLGYLADRIVDEKNEKFFYIAGVAGFVITVLGKLIFGENFYFWVDLHPGYIFFIIAVYRLIDRKVRINNVFVKKFLSFNAKYSFVFLFFTKRTRPKDPVPNVSPKV